MKKILWGLFFILSAVFVIINQLGYLTSVNIFSLIATIILIPIIIKSIFKFNFFGVLFSLAIIAIIYAEPLNIENLTPIPVLLAATLCSIGLSIIFDKHYIYGGKFGKTYIYNNSKTTANSEFDIDNKEVIDFKVSFSSGIKYINSDDLKKVSLSCSFGGMKVYLDNAKILNNEAVIDVNMSFSGLELFIPKEWKIIDKTNKILGGVEIKNNHSTGYNKTVILTGTINLSGIEIIYI